MINPKDQQKRIEARRLELIEQAKALVTKSHEQLLSKIPEMKLFQLQELVKEVCPHDQGFGPSADEDSPSAVCSACGKWSGWWCLIKEGPCEYDEINDPSCDHCIHCGEPDERK